MLPTEILLDNLLYDASEMTIPTDEVDEHVAEAPPRALRARPHEHRIRRGAARWSDRRAPA